MGEMADAVLEGLFCEACGELIDGDEPGHPRRCGAPCCEPEPPFSYQFGGKTPAVRKAARIDRERHNSAHERKAKKALLRDEKLDETKPFKCSDCSKRFSDSNARGQHWRDKHKTGGEG